MKNMIIKMMGLAMLAIIGTNGAYAQRTVNGGHKVARTTNVGKGHAAAPATKGIAHKDSHVAHAPAPAMHHAPAPADHAVHPAHVFHTPAPHHVAIAPRPHTLPAHFHILPAPRPHMVAGTLVEYLPANCMVVYMGGLPYYFSNGVHYAPIVYEGRVLYRVV